jgi:hypothetical protein
MNTSQIRSINIIEGYTGAGKSNQWTLCVGKENYDKEAWKSVRDQINDHCKLSI